MLAMLVGFSFSSPAQTIIKFAGEGSFGFSGDGGPATSARIWNPTNITFDGSGNLFIADQLNNRIRKVSPGGIISTVAGNGTKGFSGDGGSATSAALDYPYAVVADASGNLYIADHNNHRIRKVSTSGIISTIAGTGLGDFQGDGGAALSARLYHPSGLALAADGTLFFADQSNNRIRKINTGGIISTVTTASSPADVALDNSGNLYFTEKYSPFIGGSISRVRKVSSDGTVSTIAGNGTAGFSGDGGPATSALVSSPAGLTVASDGSIYIADTKNHRVRKIDSNGIISTIAGNGGNGSFNGNGGIATKAALDSPSDVALDASGSIYIADQENNMIRKLVAPTVTLPTPLCRQASSFELFYTSTVISADQYSVTGAGISPNQTGTAPGTSGSVIVNFDPATFTGAFTLTLSSNLTGFAAAPVNGTVSADIAPTAFAVTGNGAFCAGDPAGAIGLAGSQTGVNYQLFRGETTVGSPVAGTGSTISFGTVAQANTYTVIGTNTTTGCRTTMTGLAKIDSAFVANLTKSNDLSSGVSTATLTATPTNSQIYSYVFTGPGVVSQNPTSNVATVNATGSYTVKISRSQGCFATATVFVEQAKLINTIAGTGIPGINGDGGSATAAMLQSPYGVAVDGAGNVYIADQFNHRIRKVSPGGGISTVAGKGTAGFGGDGGPATSALLAAPANVAVDGAGNLYIADRNNNRIRRVGTNGIISTVAGTGAYGFSGDGILATDASLADPSGVALDSEGNLLIADAGNFRIRRVNASGIISTVAGNGTYGFSGDGGGATDAKLSFASGIAADGDGNFYIADTDNHRVRKVGSPSTLVISIKSGNWDDPTTWNVNRVPVAGDQVTLDEGHTVTVAGTQTALSLDYHTNAQLVFSGLGSALMLGQ